jgi:hypothetical protein
MSLHVSLRQVSNTLAVTLLAAAVCAVEASAQQAPKAQANPVQAPSGKAPAVKATTQAAPQQAAPAAGMVVFVDPVTGQIRQPDAAEIGTLTGAGNGNARTTLQSTPASAQPIMINGPGGGIGVRLGEDSLSYMVVTRTPEGKLVEDCVTGEKAASAVVSKGVMPKTTAAPKKNAGVLDDK